jgi:hypothetical protein
LSTHLIFCWSITYHNCLKALTLIAAFEARIIIITPEWIERGAWEEWIESARSFKFVAVL